MSISKEAAEEAVELLRDAGRLRDYAQHFARRPLEMISLAGLPLPKGGGTAMRDAAAKAAVPGITAFLLDQAAIMEKRAADRGVGAAEAAAAVEDGPTETEGNWTLPLDKAWIILYDLPEGGHETMLLGPPDATHKHFGMHIADLVRHVAKRFDVDEADVLSMVHAELDSPTTGITGGRAQ